MYSVVYKAVTLYDPAHSTRIVGVVYGLQDTLYRIDVICKFTGRSIFSLTEQGFRGPL